MANGSAAGAGAEGTAGCSTAEVGSAGGVDTGARRRTALAAADWMSMLDVVVVVVVVFTIVVVAALVAT